MRIVTAFSFCLFFTMTLLDARAEEAAMHANVSSLSGTYWWVEDIDGQGVIDRSHTTIGFPDENQVAGDGACNRYMGSYEQMGDRLKFGALASTRRACPSAVMDQDARFHAALARVVSFKLEAMGLLYLLDDTGDVVVRAFSIEQDEL